MPEDVVSPGNIWFSNDLPENDTDRTDRSIIFEDGVLARESSWPWVVGITSGPKLDYCHVGIVSTRSICGSFNNFNYSDITYAEYEDILHNEEIKEMVTIIT